MKRNALTVGFLLLILVLVFIFKDNISNYIINTFLFNDEVIINSPNSYKLDYKYGYFIETDDYHSKSKQHTLNLFYTFLNNGDDDFFFYCDYQNCENDVNDLIESDDIVNINNFVHPYNSYRKINVTINNRKKVSVTVEKSYTNSIIEAVNKKLDEIEQKIITNTMSTEEKIKVFHDYIINNSKYDFEYVNNNVADIDSPSHKAIGPLFYQKALCGGYADVMSIFLDRLNIENYRIASQFHVWNLVKMDNKWLHLDLTWDDPVTSDNSDMLLHTFFLISDEDLKKMNTGYHLYNENIYLEI